VSHNPSDIILICLFGAQEICLIINFESRNRCYQCLNHAT